MLKVSGKIARLKFNAKRYNAAVLKQLSIEQKRAVTAWVKAVAHSIPVYTGTALGTIAPVGKTVGYILVPLGRNTTKKFFYYKGKKYPLGFGMGKTYQEHSLDMELVGNKATYIFRFSEKLPYVVWNTMYPAPVSINLTHSTPWHALQKGIAAYVQYAKTEIPKNLPKHFKFLHVKVVKVL